ncbi:NUDIX domain-containing protein [Pseudarthrobacter phenanthrenivorans]|uniref:NUDIX domain-containing protein n=1 Tax=Pseudarthrobacter phenanthrenivorans TaxID=361575 RepID=UPI00344BD2C2
MSIIDISPAITAEPDTRADIPRDRIVVAAVVEWRGRIALFRRNRRVGHDSGRWHCISGYVEPGTTPVQQVFDELFEETGLEAKDVLNLRPGPELVLVDGRGASWLVYTFTAVTNQRRLSLNWEHDSYRWTTPHKWRRFTNRVSWLEDVLSATGHLPRSSGRVDGTNWARDMAGRKPVRQ